MIENFKEDFKNSSSDKPVITYLSLDISLNNTFSDFAIKVTQSTIKTTTLSVIICLLESSSEFLVNCDIYVQKTHICCIAVSQISLQNYTPFAAKEKVKLMVWLTTVLFDPHLPISSDQFWQLEVNGIKFSLDLLTQTVY